MADRVTIFRNDLAFAANPTGFPTKNGHNFVIPNPATIQQTGVALQARCQLARFFASDGTETIDPDTIDPSPIDPHRLCLELEPKPDSLFEAPIKRLQLPEDLGFIP